MHTREVPFTAPSARNTTLGTFVIFIAVCKNSYIFYKQLTVSK